MFGQFDDSLSAPSPQYSKAQVGYSRGNDGPNKLGYYYPHSVIVDTSNNRLFVADSDNHRILVYGLDGTNELVDYIPDYVIGQSNFATGQNNLAANRFERPYGMAFEQSSGYLYVADQLNNRVLVFDMGSLSNGMSATYVLGQPNTGVDTSGCTDSLMNGPTGLAIDGNNSRLFVADTGNNRVLQFDTSSLSDGMAASHVLGQTNFTTCTSGLLDWKFNAPYGLAFDPDFSEGSNRLFVADANNNRALSFDTTTVDDGESASGVYGQADFTSNAGATSQAGLFFPRGIAFDGTDAAHDRLFIASGSHRVTVYDVTNVQQGQNAENVLGQSNYTNSSSATTQSGLQGPSQIFFESGNKFLYVADQFNHRIMRFDVNAITNGENATTVLGQYDSSLTAPAPLYTKGYPDNGPSKLGMWGSQVGDAIDTTNHRLFVSDSFNNRILVFNLNTSNQLAERIPDNVIGQSTFTSSGITVSSTGLNKPRGMVLDQANNRLFVADSLNNRVLMYDTSSISDGMAATRVLGQTTFTASGVNTTQAGLGRPIGLAYRSSDQTLFVSDRLNNRVLAYDVSTVTNGENATSVLGQTNFTTSTAGTTQAKFDIPYGLAHDSTANVHPSTQLLYRLS
jgi:DNA-binding beta-propeller fold protein YncE